jgi:hypothetical protein
MIWIEGIPVLAARFAAEQKAKAWLAKTRGSTFENRTQKAPVDRRTTMMKPAEKAA